MRDPARIERVLRLLKLAWSSQPDLRLCQLLMNATDRDRGDDMYYVEDDTVENSLKDQVVR